jgi:predicted CopG family antitoxin
MTKPIRVSEESHEFLQKLADSKRQSVREVLDEIIEEKRRETLFDAIDAYYEKLQQQPQAWQAELAERAVWDKTLRDGLDTDE